MKNLLVQFLVVFISSVNLLQARTIPVCSTCEIKTIKEAILQASDLDTLLIKKGIYREFNIHINKPLTILGEEYPVIDGEDKGEIITITADNVTLDGLRVMNVGTSYTTDYAAIRLIKCRDFVIRNTILEKLFFGIYLEKASHGKILNNRIKGDAVDEFGSGNGIHLWYAKNIEIRSNDIQHVRDGIYFEFADNCIIKDNYSHNNIRYGLHFMFSNHDVYEGNTFEKNGAGVAVMFSKFINMYSNTFKNNWGTASYGLLLKEINDAEIIGNIFEENTIGINIEGTNRIVYSDNNFIGNGWALKVRGAVYTNSFVNNNFLYNSFDLSYNSNLNDNIFDKNYWSGYTGYDLDKDGIGDVPYRPVRLFSYIVNRTPETIILLRSLFMDIIDFSEKVSPVFTPDNLLDANPVMKKINTETRI
ncbi:nitrous oxide reductase family maturation protein NosD [Flavobacteriaceae bacterium F89]|uniref:Nitrous oxide reductase family maturation protein NosD n=1 Tax=Cerina litoralis TaxID=2874477 RepID=A0AAE3EXJ5_9FLAO|nr:nitrous oxide reductase family maturation protein NosD [Cerina litoralis]MCG2462743.1 nitrous oxide reductase family maturation protein NosD [Cerina litoralis]